MQIFEKTYLPTYSHIDWRGVARPSALFDFMQDAATLHARALSLDSGDLGYMWVLSRMHLVLDRPLLPYTPVTVETWCAGIKGASWLRAFSFAAEGVPVGQALSTWVILDPVTHRPVRPSIVPGAADYACEDRPTLPIPGKLACAELPLHHVHRVGYADLDVNRHLNNVKIADLVSDALEPGENDFVCDLQINYTAETTGGTLLELSALREDGAFRAAGAADGRERFAAAGRIIPLVR